MKTTDQPLEPAAREIFFRALEFTSSEERREFLARACHADPNLQAVLENLVKNCSQDNFLEHSPIPRTRGLLSDDYLEHGSLIDRYRLIEKIGEGGCGAVYRAEQLEGIRRQLALKVIKPGMDSKAVIARFEAERQALALMITCISQKSSTQVVPSKAGRTS